jgi:peptide/nickel transport system ATP-binding protein
METIISVKNLSLLFPLRYGTVKALRNVSIDIPRGKVTALVGESGSGKTTLATALMKLISFPGEITEGEILYQGKDVVKMTPQQLHRYRWEEIAMVFQAAQSALNPVMRVKDMIVETYLAHRPKTPEKRIVARISQLLEFVRLEPERILASYPHELSGGMKQRVMIAFSLLLEPKFLILDEPTTALDVITQDYIFEILARIRREMDVTMLLLTHDISVVAKVSDRIAVMYAGKIVEEGDIYKVFEQRKHPYTRQLIGSVPSIAEDAPSQIEVTSAPLDLFNLPAGCALIDRCPFAKPVCTKIESAPFVLSDDHRVFCHLYSNAEYGKEALIRGE